MKTAACTLACSFVLTAAVARADGERAMTTVHLEGANKRVALEHVGDYDAACHGVCGVEVPNGIYRVAGKNVVPSAPFIVDGGSAVYLVNVHPARPPGSRAGKALAISGGAALGVGVLFGVLALATMNQPSCGGWCFVNPAPLFGVMAGVFGGVGLLLFIPGVSMMSASSDAKPTPTTVNRIAGFGLTKTF